MPQELSDATAFLIASVRKTANSVEFLGVESKDHLMPFSFSREKCAGIRNAKMQEEIDNTVKALAIQRDTIVQLKDAITEATKSLRRVRNDIGKERLASEKTVVAPRQYTDL